MGSSDPVCTIKGKFMDTNERLQPHTPEKEKKPKEKGGFWAKPGRAATLSMWSAILCIIFSAWYIYPKNETNGIICTAICCMWAGASLVRAEQDKKAAKGQYTPKSKASDYVRSDSILGYLMGKNKNRR